MPQCNRKNKMTARSVLSGILVCVLSWPAFSESPADKPSADAVIPITAFGERANFSPDGSRIVFIGKNYGDAYEIALASRKIRNITNNIPHQGIHRIQYLPNGDFLVTAPRLFTGANTRARLEMWILDDGLQTGLQPLGEGVMEGIAVSRKRNLIAWTAVEPKVTLEKGQPWEILFSKPTKRYVAEIKYDNGTPAIANKREIISEMPADCNFIEPQDFRNSDKELVFSCLKFSATGGIVVSVMGYNLVTGDFITYRRESGEYNEVEGIAPDGTWSAVECGIQDVAGIPPLDMCRLELKPDGKITRLLPHIPKSVLGEVSNPVISPDGKWVAYQKSARSESEYGEGLGLFMSRIVE